MSNSNNPYLSIVVASRNDDHGGDMLKRMTFFVRGLIHQCNKFKLPCELIMVEWNPPQERPLLKFVLPAVSSDDYLHIRYIVVPDTVHNQLAYSNKLPLFQMIAKNVGIQRARAKFILCANVDLLFSDKLFTRLAQRNLEEGKVYRANRCDVPNTLDEKLPVDKQLEFCERNILKRLGKNSRYSNFTHTSGFLFKHFIFIPLLLILSKNKISLCNVSDR